MAQNDEDERERHVSEVALAAMFGLLCNKVDKYVKARARNTIAENAGRDPARPRVGFIADPGACENCQGMAAVGPVPADEARKLARRPHPKCDCQQGLFFSKARGGTGRRNGGGASNAGDGKFRVLDDDSIDRLQERSDILYASMTNAELAASKAYTTDKNGFINGFLFGNAKNDSIWDDDTIRGFIENLRSSMTRFELDDDITVFKGVPARHYEDWKLGETRTFSGFLSTSARQEIAREYFRKSQKGNEGALMFEIRVPRGTMSMYVGRNTNAELGNEFELLIANGARLRLLERSGDRMVMEVTGFE